MPRERSFPLWNAIARGEPTEVASFVKYPPRVEAAALALRDVAAKLPVGFAPVSPKEDLAATLWGLLFERHSPRRFHGTSIYFAWACVRFAALGAGDFNTSGASQLGAWLVTATWKTLVRVLTEAAALAERSPLPPPSGPCRTSPMRRPGDFTHERRQAAQALRAMSRRYLPGDFDAVKDRSARLAILLGLLDRHCTHPRAWLLADDALTQAVFGVPVTSHPPGLTDWLRRASRRGLVLALAAAARWVPLLPFRELRHAS